MEPCLGQQRAGLLYALGDLFQHPLMPRPVALERPRLEGCERGFGTHVQEHCGDQGVLYGGGHCLHGAAHNCLDAATIVVVLLERLLQARNEAAIVHLHPTGMRIMLWVRENSHMAAGLLQEEEELRAAQLRFNIWNGLFLQLPRRQLRALDPREHRVADTQGLVWLQYIAEAAFAVWKEVCLQCCEDLRLHNRLVWSEAGEQYRPPEQQQLSNCWDPGAHVVHHVGPNSGVEGADKAWPLQMLLHVGLMRQTGIGVYPPPR
mmetsp:Transcript_50302/g.145888  ORF Transcript_50302/g.145888 Transcript_50302/m.145888 type:complete len:262 (+) Transcript_50302:382-1167(+)